ncbi:Leucine-rich repeat and calponin y domain-containing protein 3 [Nymphon striatum]|nr:Leucine-rich repeat and calponin y domain-containing protein 3 [Nymphon striatum]
MIGQHRLDDVIGPRGKHLSKNKLVELPEDVCGFNSLERLSCYHNVIRTIPNSIIFLQCLTSLDLSRNQLTTIPAVLCRLPLEVLLLSNNKLVSLPEEIGHLQTLMDLDVSCNEISHLPVQIQDLNALRTLNMRRNLLQELPSGLSRLNLVRLDISGNKISELPASFRLIDSLTELNLDHNPLTSPPAFLCTRGKVHIFKYLENQAVKEDRKRGLMPETGYRKSFRKPTQNETRFPNGYLSMPEPLSNKQKRCTVDSGYNTSEGSDNIRWSQEFQDITNTLISNNEADDPRRLALRAAELTKEQRSERNKHRTNSCGVENQNSGLNHSNSIYSDHSGCSTPSTLSPGSDMNLEAEFNRELEKQRKLYNEDKIERLRREQLLENESNERRVVAVKVFEQQRENARKNAEMNGECRPVINGHSGQNGEQLHIQTYREYKESLKSQRSHDIYNRRTSDPNPAHILETRNGHTNSPTTTSSKTEIDFEEELQLKMENKMNLQKQEHEKTQKRMEDERHKMKKIQKEAVLSFVKQRTSSSESELSPTSPPTGSIYGSNSILLKSRGQSTNSPKRSEDVLKAPLGKSKNVNYNSQTAVSKVKEEADSILELRHVIEQRLKVELPQDLSCALIDGVVLCHLANNVRPRSVPSIHVPSPAVPKLTLAKCQRNVENFLNACQMIGVSEDLLCSPHDILDEKNIIGVATSVRQLMNFATPLNGHHHNSSY